MVKTCMEIPVISPPIDNPIISIYTTESIIFMRVTVWLLVETYYSILQQSQEVEREDRDLIAL